MDNGDKTPVETALDFCWLFTCLGLVLLMQAGFAAYEVGVCVQKLVGIKT